MLFMGEEWATSAPFLYFADHEDEQMREQVAEGRKQEFAAFGFDGDIPNPEDQSSYEHSKLKWQEQTEGKHAEMLAWVKALIKLRRRTVALNDGDMHHLVVVANEEHRTLVLQRDEARIVLNFGEDPYAFSLLEGEKLVLSSREDLKLQNNQVDLPPVTMAVLLSTPEALANRLVNSRTR